MLKTRKKFPRIFILVSSKMNVSLILKRKKISVKITSLACRDGACFIIPALRKAEPGGSL